jgi:Flp pilus assembly protein TadD
VLRILGQTEEAQQQLKLFEERQQAALKLAQGVTSEGQAAQALKDGNPAQAVTLYRQALEAQPKNEVYAYNLAVALGKAGDTAGERAALEQAVMLKPGFASAENQLGLLLTRSNELTLAELHFRRALEAAPRYAEAANNLGTLLGQQGRDRDAEVLFRSAVSANPRFTEAWVNLAATLASQSHFAGAKEAVESALRSNPKDPDALRLQAMLANTGNPSASPHAPSKKSSTQVPH